MKSPRDGGIVHMDNFAQDLEELLAKYRRLITAGRYGGGGEEYVASLNEDFKEDKKIFLEYGEEPDFE